MAELSEGIQHLLLDAMDTHVRRTCFFVKQNRHYQTLTFRQVRTQAMRLAYYFISHGISHGERVAIIARNRPEWFVAYVAAQLSGAIAVPIRHSLPDHQLRYMLADCGARLALVQDAAHYQIVERLDQQLPQLRAIMLMDTITGSSATTLELARILDRPISASAERTVRENALVLDGSGIAAIHYTHSDDGRLRGACFDRTQICKMLKSMSAWIELDEDDLAYSPPQPWSDLANLSATLLYFCAGVPNALAVGNESYFDDLQHTSPTVTLTIPWAFQLIYFQVMHEVETLPRSSQEVFRWALTVGHEYHSAGIAATAELSESYRRADMTFFSNIRAKMGGRLRRFYSTGAPLSPEWTEFAEAIGLLPLNVYAVTKAGGFPCASCPTSRRAGSCGQVAGGFQIRIADDGEVLVRGDTVMRGYWDALDHVADPIDAEGWLHTGDLGRFDSDGYLYLTGHKQSPLMLATGRKVQPALIENRLLESPFIAQAMICGQGQQYVTALIVPDFTAVRDHLESRGLQINEEAKSTDNPAVTALVDIVVQNVNNELDGWEHIQKYTLLDNYLEEINGEPVAPNHLDRTRLMGRYSAQIASMYPTLTPLQQGKVTQVELEPEHLRQLLEKEDILDAWMNDAGIGFLFDLARSKQIDGPSMVNICETIAAVAQMRNEERPLSTAIIVGSPARIRRILPECTLQLRRYDHIRRMRRIVTGLAKIVDGRVLAYVIDRHGFVRGINRLDVELEDIGSDLTGAHFRHLAAISSACDSVVFSVPAGGRQARVFCDGRLVGRYLDGVWQAEEYGQVDAAVERLAHQKQCDLSILRRLVRCAVRMSESNQGAILLLGDARAILARSDISDIQNIASMVRLPMTEISDEELMVYAKQDGATVIDTSGELHGFMVLLRPAASTTADVSPGKGARHSSAAKMSAETGCIAITVSQDGPIAVYDAGKRVLSL